MTKLISVKKEETTNRQKTGTEKR